MNKRNIFQDLPSDLRKEFFEDLITSEAFTLVRIISRGQATAPGVWYDQDKNEWVVLLQGHAGLLFEDAAGVLEMQPGDFVHIPAGLKHRVEWTKEGANTIWLALHYQD